MTEHPAARDLGGNRTRALSDSGAFDTMFV
jgi:hypothetical protein